MILNDKKKRIFNMYKIESSKTCQDCLNARDDYVKSTVGPITLFHIGKNIDRSQKRILFVGKTDWHNNRSLHSYKEKFGSFYNATELGAEALDPQEGYIGGFWVNLRFFIESFKKQDIDFSITNLSKCHLYDCHSDHQETEITPDIFYEHCFKIFKKEILILKPTHIIFLTGNDFDYLLKDMNFPNLTYRNRVPINTKIRVKNANNEWNKQIWWWRTYYKEDKTKMHFLRTYHPQSWPFDMRFKILKWITHTRVCSENI